MLGQQRTIVAVSKTVLRKRIEAILQTAGFLVIGEAADGITALKLVRSRQPDLVIIESALKKRLGYDDALDVFGIHGIGGTWGALATGIFAEAAIGGTNGLLYGNPAQLGIQAVAVLASYAFVAVMTFAVLKVVGVFTPLRVTEKEEDAGLDIMLHGEEGYSVYVGGGELYREQPGMPTGA